MRIFWGMVKTILGILRVSTSLGDMKLAVAPESIMDKNVYAWFLGLI
jgi:hypothetical protein